MLSEAIPSAFAAAIYPPALIIVAYMLEQVHPLRHGLAFLAGAAAITLAVGYAVALVLQGSGAENSRHHPTVPGWLDIAVGLAILAFAAVVARRPPRPPKAPQERRDTGLPGVVGLGVLMFTPSPLYLAALHALAKGDSSTLTLSVEVLLIAAIVLLLVEVPVALYAVDPQRTSRVLKAANGWLAAHGRMIIVIASGVIGAYFVASGISHLT
jgi:hypothetical protein